MTEPTKTTPFVILGLPRTGSNMLLSGLQQHPNVVAFNERYNTGKVIFGYPDLDKRHMEDQALLAFRNENPVSFAEQTVFAPQDETILAAGFKIFHYQLDSPKLRLLWGYLRDKEHLRVLSLKRRNMFKQLTSYRLAQETQKWVGQDYSVDGIRIDHADCEAMFAKWEAMSEKSSAMLQDKPTMCLYYEDVAADYTGTLGQVFQFLGVPDLAVRPLTKKQRKRPIQDIVTNYAELKKHFAGSRWAEFFMD